MDAARGALTLLPHDPYGQSSAVDGLDGGFQRHVEPLDNTFVKHVRPLLNALGR